MFIATQWQYFRYWYVISDQSCEQNQSERGHLVLARKIEKGRWLGKRQAWEVSHGEIAQGKQATGKCPWESDLRPNSNNIFFFNCEVCRDSKLSQKFDVFDYYLPQLFDKTTALK